MNRQITATSEFQSFESTSGLSKATTVGELIRYRAGVQPDHPAIACSHFASLSYRDLQRVIDGIRTSLRSAGLGRSARIAIAIPSGPQAAIAIVAIACSAVSIPLNPKQTVREIESCLKALEPDAILLIKNGDPATRQAAERQGVAVVEVVAGENGELDLDIVTPGRGALKDGEPDEPDTNAPAFILQTSGTAAEPKLIPFSHRNMLAASFRLRDWFNLTPQDRCLSVSPPFYSHGLKVTVFTPLLTGGTVVFPVDASKFDYSEWFTLLKPTWYSAGPTLHRLVFDHIQSIPDAKTGHSLRFILSGGAPLPRNVLDGLSSALAVPVVEHYGSSEAAQIAVNQPPPGRSKLGTCGIPWPGTLMIVGEDGSAVGPDELGEILLGGPTLVSGYLNAPELNRVSFANGWFRTGDIGSLDQDGFLTLHGRKDDVINRGAEKISPVEIDEALMRHPAVAEAAAFPVPHARLGEDVAAAVVLRPGVTATGVELRKYLQDHLVSFKIPRRIIFKDQLPKGKTGKVQRRKLSSSFGGEVAAEMSTSGPRPNEDTAVDGTLASQLTELWERLLQTKPIRLDDDFADKGGDSLLAMDMLSEVEGVTGRIIPSSILFEARTIRQLAQKLAGLDIKPKPVVPLNRDGRSLPLFLFHGDYKGGGLYAIRLATLLGADQPLLVIAPHDLGGEAVPRTIEAIAADQLALVKNAQARGPYRLSGYCLWGLVAFEVARLLIASGEKVEFVAMIDTPAVNARKSVQTLLSAIRRVKAISPSFADRLAAHTWHKCSILLDRTSNISVAQLFAWIGYTLQRRLAGGRKIAVPTIIANRAGNELRLRQLFEWHISDRRGNVDSLTMYSPKPLSIPVVFFEAEFSSSPWRRMSGDIEAVKLEGNHDRMADDPHAEAVRDSTNLRGIASLLSARLRLR